MSVHTGKPLCNRVQSSCIDSFDGLHITRAMLYLSARSKILVCITTQYAASSKYVRQPHTVCLRLVNHAVALTTAASWHWQLLLALFSMSQPSAQIVPSLDPPNTACSASHPTLPRHCLAAILPKQGATPACNSTVLTRALLHAVIAVVHHIQMQHSSK